MRTRRTSNRHSRAVVGVLLTVVVALTGTTVAEAGVPHFKHCGTLRGPGARFAILAHRAHCRTARRVIRALFAGRGRDRTDPSTGQIDKVIDGWFCGGGAGGFGCAKLGPHGTIRPYSPRRPLIDAAAL